MRNRIQAVDDEVLFTREPVTLVDAAEIAALKVLAAGKPRRRVRLCAHPQPGDPLHEMLILHGRDAYVRPHRHAEKPESFLVVEGRARLFLFDDAGSVTHSEDVGDPASGLAFYARFPAGQYHCFVITSAWLVFHETTLGPFDRTQMHPAPWAPDDTDADAVAAYLDHLMQHPVTAHPDTAHPDTAVPAATALRETAHAL